MRVYKGKAELDNITCVPGEGWSSALGLQGIVYGSGDFNSAVHTTFKGISGYYYSPDGKNIGGGGNSPRVH